MNFKKLFSSAAALIMCFMTGVAAEKVMSVAECDALMAARSEKADDAGLVWLNVGDAPMELSGFFWYQKDKVLRRLPMDMDPAITPAVRNLSWHTAGGKLRFRTDSKRIVVRVKLRARGVMPHMALTGSGGFDLYVGAPGKEVYFNTTKSIDLQYDYTLFQHARKELRTITINFPLYQSVESLHIGFDKESKLLPPEPLKKYVAVYGTSITQGGCAARPGMAWTNIISRRLQRHFYNYGFSGSAKGEPEMAKLLGTLDPSMYILAFQSNAGNNYLPRLKEFITILRKAHPETPIVVVSTFFRPRSSERSHLTNAQKQHEIVENFRKAGDKNIYSVDGSASMDPYRYEATVDGTHPTDLGFILQANFIQKFIEPLLADKE